MNKLRILFLLFGISILLFNSCKKEIEGCMDATADNYDPKATVAGKCEFKGCMDAAAENFNPKANVEGECIYARDKFIGSYKGALSCPGPLTTINGETTFTIDEDIAGAVNEVTVLIKTNTGLTIPVKGVCSGNNLSIDATVKMVTILVAGNPIVADVVAKGTVTYNETTKVLSGPLSITAVTILFPIADNCTITGTKQ